MADKEKPEEDKAKAEGKKLLPGISKIPLDGILLVVVPFITFVLLFLHLMGFLPPQPVVIHVIDSGIAASHKTAGDTEFPVETDASQAEVPPTEQPTAAVEAPPPADDTGAADLVTDEVPPAQGTDDAGAETDFATGGDEPVDQASFPLDGHEKKIKQLAKVYEQMNAASVAAIVTNMSDDEAIDILSNMKPRNAAKVLASLAPERAAALSLMLAR